MTEPMCWKDWLKDQRIRREWTRKSRPKSPAVHLGSSNRCLHKLYKGEHELPFKRRTRKCEKIACEPLIFCLNG